MHALVRFSNIAAGGRFTTADLYAPTLDTLGLTESQYSLASFRYDLSKLRAKGLLEKVPRSRRYQMLGIVRVVELHPLAGEVQFHFSGVRCAHKTQR